MVERVKIGYGIFAKAAVFVVVIFAAGLAFGLILDSFRTSFLNEEMISANIETESFVTSQIFLANNPDYCNLTKDYLPKVSEDVEQLGKDISALGEKMVFVNSSFLDRRYFLYEIRLWLMFEEYKKRCNSTVDTVLFFYGDQDEPSYTQGLELTAVKNQFKDNVMVFSFKYGFNESALELVESTYKITTVPSLVIDGVLYPGFLDKDELISILSA